MLVVAEIDTFNVLSLRDEFRTLSDDCLIATQTVHPTASAVQ